MADNPSATREIRLGDASAYAIAVSHGYQGTEAEWIQELMDTSANAGAAAQSAQDAAGSAEAAAGSAQDAADAKDLAVAAIGEAKTEALGDLSNAKDAAIGDIGDAKTAALGDLSDSRDAILAEGGIQKQAVIDEANVQIGLVSAEGTAQVGAVQDQEALSVAAVEAKGEEVIQSIPADYTELSGEVSDLKSAVSDIEDEIYSFTQRTETTSSTGWRLNESDGLCSSNSGYKLVKYTVTAGDMVKVVSDDRFQFQTDASVPSSGTNNRVGATYGAGTFILTVPETATYLIVSTPTTSSAAVFDVVSIVDGLLNSVDKLQNDLDDIEDITVLTEDTESAALIGDSDVIEKKLLNTDGTLADFNNSGWKVSIPVDISAYDHLIVTAGSGYDHLLYAFYDEAETYILNSGLNSGSGVLNITSENVSIPAGAKYIRVARNGNAAMSLQGVSRVRVNSASRKWHSKKWTCVGDSLTESNLRSTMNYHDYIAQATGITVVNMGKSGTGYKRTYDEGFAFYQRISNVPTDSDVVTIFGSGNDLTYISDLGTPTDSGSDTNPTTICGCINKTIDTLIALIPTVQLGIVAPTPWIGQQPTLNNSNSMGQYVEALRQICYIRSIPFLDLYHESNLRPWTEEGRNACYSKDEGNGVHPDETGHRIIASRFEGFLDSLLLGN